MQCYIGYAMSERQVKIKKYVSVCSSRGKHSECLVFYFTCRKFWDDCSGSGIDTNILFYVD